MKEESSVSKLCIKYGALAAGGLILYFVLMNALQLLHVVELRFLNFIFLASAIVMGISHFQGNGKGVSYFDGLNLGMGISLVATFAFALFVYLFLNINPDFMQYIIEHAPFGEFLSPAMCSVIVIFEGLASGVVVTYSAMQYFKKETAPSS